MTALDDTRINSMHEAKMLIHEVVEKLGRAYEQRLNEESVDPRLIREARDLAMEARSTLTAQLSLEGDVDTARTIAQQVRDQGGEL